MQDGVMSWCSSQFLCRQSSELSLCTFSHIMWNWLFHLPGRILCEQSPRYQRKLWACSWLYSSHVSPFSVSVSLDFLCMAHAFFFKILSNHCQGLCHTFFEVAQNLMLFLCWIHRGIASVQIHDFKWKDVKKSAGQLTGVKFYTLTPKIC
jgi:hypothetical protein